MIAVIAGALITEFAGISTLDRRELTPSRLVNRMLMKNSTSNCNWDNLEWLILGGHVLLMLLVSVPACFLIPNVPQDASLLTEEPPKVQEEGLMVDDTSDIMLI